MSTNYINTYTSEWTGFFFFWQGNTQEELPEILLGTCRLNHLDVAKSLLVKPWKYLPPKVFHPLRTSTGLVEFECRLMMPFVSPKIFKIFPLIWWRRECQKKTDLYWFFSDLTLYRSVDFFLSNMNFQLNCKELLFHLALWVNSQIKNKKEKNLL